MGSFITDINTELEGKAVIVAGLVGGLISMNFVDGMTAKQRLAAILAGATIAHYLSPLIAFLFNMRDYQETIGFLVGLFGMSICSAIFKAIKDSDLWAIIEQRLTAQKNTSGE